MQLARQVQDLFDPATIAVGTEGHGIVIVVYTPGERGWVDRFEQRFTGREARHLVEHDGCPIVTALSAGRRHHQKCHAS